jgi:hypothetical protein
MSDKSLYDQVLTVLLSCRLARRSLSSEGAEEREAPPKYTVSIDPVRKSTVICHIEVVGHDVDRTYSIIRANYLIAFQPEMSAESTQSIEEMVERTVNNTIWPRFRDLFSLMVSQANMDLPQLPMRPNKIEKLA